MFFLYLYKERLVNKIIMIFYVFNNMLNEIPKKKKKINIIEVKV